MANPTAAFGIRGIKSEFPVRHLDCVIPASDSTVYAPGTPVKIVSGGNSTDNNGNTVPTVIVVGTGDAPFGVVESVYSLTNDKLSYRPASVKTQVRVRLLTVGDQYEIRADGTIAASDIFKYAGFTVGTDVLTTSGTALKVADLDTTATRPMRVIGFLKSPDNEISANAVVIVEHNVRG